jgi:hypothetical protein
MNESLLRQVKAHILAEPKRLIMTQYVVKKSETERYIPHRTGIPSVFGLRSFPECGTVACIAGWGALLTGMRLDFEYDYASLFGLTQYQASRLFNPRMWPGQFQRGTWDDGTPEAARAAADRIDFFIETKGTDKADRTGAEAVVKAEAELETHWHVLSNMLRYPETDAPNIIRYPEATDTDAPRETVLQETSA